MIVKNESHVIERCLKSLLPLIDYWVIVDTGSTDGTQDVIHNFMSSQGVSGELHERHWKNFAFNRNEALELAKGKSDYIFLIDADEFLKFEKDFQLPHLNKDYYTITIKHAGLLYHRTVLIKNDLDFKYRGVLHEVLIPPLCCTSEHLTKVQNIYTTEGARSQDPLKFHYDVKILTAALEEEPFNERYVFYLAQSYHDAKDYENALKYYTQRSAMGGWEEEIFYSLFRMALLKEILEYPLENVIQSYQRAYAFRPTRIEPLYHLARLYRIQHNYELGYEVVLLAQKQPVCEDILFVENWMYLYGLPLEQSICAYWLGKYEECQEISHALLQDSEIPSTLASFVKHNLVCSNQKISEKLLSL